MNFLNLSLGELAGLAGVISAAIVALYLFDRSKRKQVVATLRFWTPSEGQVSSKHRRHVQQPISLALQLISILLLLLALADPRFGGSEDSARDHVLILDTSAWMGARGPAAQGTLMDAAKRSARAYLQSLPAGDRVMLVRAGALATPATSFEANVAAVAEAVRKSQPEASSLNLPLAIEFAQRAQRLQSHKAGEIVFVGSGRVAEQDTANIVAPSNLRVLTVAATGENIGLRKMGVRRSPASPQTWEILIGVRNYGLHPHAVDLELQFGGAPVGSKHFTLQPGAEEQATFAYATQAAGWLEARIRPEPGMRDIFPQDDRAVMELPANHGVNVLVYTSQPELLRPLLASNAQVHATFKAPGEYQPAVKGDTKPDIIVLDRFAPKARPDANAIWIAPPADGSPIPVKGVQANVRLTQWRQETALGQGLNTKDVLLASSERFTTSPNDIPVAESADGALIVARPGTNKTVVMGFHPMLSAMKYELTTPLLMANILRWMAPESFTRTDLVAGSVGTISIPVDKGTTPAGIRVEAENRVALPFTVEHDELRFFAGSPGLVHVRLGNRDLMYSLTLPDVADAVWQVPTTVRRGIPRRTAQEAPSPVFWPWLAALGGLGLLADWLLFGRPRLLPWKTVKKNPESVSWKKAS